MPEGHVTHRLARGLNAAFGGRQVRVSSPQGRFDGAAALLDGQEFRSAEAYGKNLFLGIGDAGLVHIHLGLIGKLLLDGRRELANPATLRLRIETDEHVAELRGPQTCALISPAGRRPRTWLGAGDQVAALHRVAVDGPEGGRRGGEHLPLRGPVPAAA